MKDDRILNYEFFEHTADIGVRAYGLDLPQLFLHAGVGMFSLIAARMVSGPLPLTTRRVCLVADDVELLLVNWLNDLLGEFDIAGSIPVTARFFSLKHGELTAAVAAESFSAGTHQRGVGIKAVTYHALSVRKSGALWRAEFVLDV